METSLFWNNFSSSWISILQKEPCIVAQ